MAADGSVALFSELKDVGEELQICLIRRVCLLAFFNLPVAALFHGAALRTRKNVSLARGLQGCMCGQVPVPPLRATSACVSQLAFAFIYVAVAR